MTAPAQTPEPAQKSGLSRLFGGVFNFTDAEDVEGKGVELPATNAAKLTGSVTVVGTAIAAGLAEMGIDFSGGTDDLKTAGVFALAIVLVGALLALAWITTTDIKMRGGLTEALADLEAAEEKTAEQTEATDESAVATYATALDGFLDAAELHATEPSESSSEPIRFSTAAEAYEALAEQLAGLEAPAAWKGEPRFLSKMARIRRSSSGRSTRSKTPPSASSGRWRRFGSSPSSGTTPGCTCASSTRRENGGAPGAAQASTTASLNASIRRSISGT